jgi:hypothetical protein
MQMQVPFQVGEPANQVGLHTILALHYSFIGKICLSLVVMKVLILYT